MQRKGFWKRMSDPEDIDDRMDREDSVASDMDYDRDGSYHDRRDTRVRDARGRRADDSRDDGWRVSDDYYEDRSVRRGRDTASDEDSYVTRTDRRVSGARRGSDDDRIRNDYRYRDDDRAGERERGRNDDRYDRYDSYDRYESDDRYNDYDGHDSSGRRYEDDRYDESDRENRGDRENTGSFGDVYEPDTYADGDDKGDYVDWLPSERYESRTPEPPAQQVAPEPEELHPQCFVPVAYPDIRKSLVDCLRDGNPVVVDVSRMQREDLQRLTDFVFGVALALDASFFRLDMTDVFVMTPKNTDPDPDELADALQEYKRSASSAAAATETDANPDANNP